MRRSDDGGMLPPAGFLSAERHSRSAALRAKDDKGARAGAITIDAAGPTRLPSVSAAEIRKQIEQERRERQEEQKRVDAVEVSRKVERARSRSRGRQRPRTSNAGGSVGGSAEGGSMTHASALSMNSSLVRRSLTSVRGRGGQGGASEVDDLIQQVTGLNRRVQARTAQGAAALGIDQQGMDYGDGYVDEGGLGDEQAELDALRVARDMGAARGAVATPARQRGAHKRRGRSRSRGRGVSAAEEDDAESYSMRLLEASEQVKGHSRRRQHRQRLLEQQRSDGPAAAWGTAELELGDGEYVDNLDDEYAEEEEGRGERKAGVRFGGFGDAAVDAALDEAEPEAAPSPSGSSGSTGGDESSSPPQLMAATMPVHLPSSGLPAGEEQSAVRAHAFGSSLRSAELEEQLLRKGMRRHSQGRGDFGAATAAATAVAVPGRLAAAEEATAREEAVTPLGTDVYSEDDAVYDSGGDGPLAPTAVTTGTEGGTGQYWAHWRQWVDSAGRRFESGSDASCRARLEAARALWGTALLPSTVPGTPQYAEAAALAAAGQGGGAAVRTSSERKRFQPELLFQRFSWRAAVCVDLRPWCDEIDVDLVQYIAAVGSGPLEGPVPELVMANCVVPHMPTTLRAVATHLGAHLRSLDLSGVLGRHGAKVDELGADASISSTQQLGLSAAGNLTADAVVKQILCAGGKRRCFPRLVSLSLADTPTLTDASLKALGRAAVCDAEGTRTGGLSTLLDLDVSGCPLLTDDGMLSLLGVKQMSAGADAAAARSQRLKSMGALVLRLRLLGVAHCVQLADSTLFALAKGAYAAPGASSTTAVSPLQHLDATNLPKVTSEGVAALLEAARGLETLRLEGATAIGDDAIRALLEAKTLYGYVGTGGYGSLHSLSLRGVESLSDVSVSWVAAACPMLMSLDLAGCGAGGALGGPVAMFALRGMRRLEALSLAAWDAVDDASLEALFGAPPGQAREEAEELYRSVGGDLSLGMPPRQKGLTALDLRGCRSVGARGVKAIAVACVQPGLRRLALSHADAVDDGALRFLAKKAGTTLQALSLANMRGFSGAGGAGGSGKGSFAAIAKYSRHLLELTARHCPGVGDAAVMALRPGCKRLVRLDLSGCTELSDDGVSACPPWVLREVSLSGCEHVSDRGVLGLCANMRSVDEQMVATAPLAEKDEGSAVKMIAEIEAEKAAAAAALEKGRRCRLARLDVSGCLGMTGGGVRKLCDMCEPPRADAFPSENASPPEACGVGRVAMGVPFRLDSWDARADFAASTGLHSGGYLGQQQQRRQRRQQSSGADVTWDQVFAFDAIRDRTFGGDPMQPPMRWAVGGGNAEPGGPGMVKLGFVGDGLVVNVRGCPLVGAADLRTAAVSRNTRLAAVESVLGAGGGGIPAPPSRSLAVASRPYLEAVVADGGDGFVGLRPSARGMRARASDELLKWHADVERLAIWCQCGIRRINACILANKRRNRLLRQRRAAAIMLQCMIRGRAGRKKSIERRRLHTSIAIRCQRAWRRYIERKMVARAARFMNARLYRKILHAWRRVADEGTTQREAKREAKQMAKAVHLLRNHVLLRAWPHWVQWAEGHKQRRLVMAKARGHWGHHVLPQLFERWRVNARPPPRAPYGAARRRRLALVFLACVPLERRNTAAAQLQLSVADERLRGARQTGAWLILKRFLAWRRRLWEQACAHYFRIFVANTGGSVFRAWAQYAKWRVIKHSWISRAEEHVQVVRKLRALRHLHWYADEKVRNRRGLDAAIRMFSLRIEHHCFDALKAYIVHRRAHKAQLAYAAKCWLQHEESRALRSWAAWVVERVRYRAMMEKALRWMQGHLEKHVLDAWRVVVADASDSRAAAETRALFRVMGKAFKGWKFVARNIIQKRKDLRREWDIATKAATKMQAVWRGRQGREKAEDWEAFEQWSTVVLQSLARRWLAKRIAVRMRRHKRLRELAEMEFEQELFFVEAVGAGALRMEWDAAELIKRMILGFMARQEVKVLKQLRAREKGLLFRLQQQDARDAAARAELEREQREKLEWATAQMLQRIYRGYRGRVEFTVAFELREQHRAVTRIQCFQRGRKGRRTAWAMLRVNWSNARVNERRRALAKLLRKCGFNNRSQQFPIIRKLYAIGIDPDSYNIEPPKVWKEIKEDAAAVMRDIKVEFEAWFDPKTLVRFNAWERDAIRASRTRERELAIMPKRGDVVRIRMRDHEQKGETAYVLKIDDSDPMAIQAEIRVDHTDRVEFIEMVQEATDIEARALSLHPAQKRSFNWNGKLTAQLVRENKMGIMAAAAEQRILRTEFCAARAVQMRWRSYDARCKVLDMLEAYRALVASRQAKLLQQLTAMGMVSARMGRLLAKSRLVNPDFIPDMPEKPLLPAGIVEAWRWHKTRAKYLIEAAAKMDKRKTWLQNEEAVQRRRVMRFRKMWAPRKVGSYLISKLMSHTTGAVADLFHAQAEKFNEATLFRRLNEAAANLVGGEEWRRTYEDRNAWASLYQLIHLQGSPHVVRDGWCMYHGVWGPPGVTSELGGLNPKAYKPHGDGMCEMIRGELAIVEHPRRKIVVTEGAPAGFTLSVRADGGNEPYAFVWYVKRPGMLRFVEYDPNKATQTQDLEVKEVTGGHAATYYCEISEHDPETDEHDPWADEGTAFIKAKVDKYNSEWGEVVVNPPLVIIRNPVDFIITHGGFFEIDCEVIGGTPPYTFQWRRDQGFGPKDIVTNAHESVYRMDPASQFDGGEFTCEIRDAGGGAVVCDYCTVIVHPPMAFTEQPQLRPMSAGDPIILSVEVEGGTEPYTYQWVKDAENIERDYVPDPFRFIIPAAGVKDAGRYWCVVSDSGNTHISSESVFCNIYGPVHITVVQAKEIKAMEWMMSNPFATLMLNTEEHKTRTIDRTLAPVWTRWDELGERIVSEHYVMSVTDMANMLTVYIEHKKDLGPAEFLGKVEIPIMDLKDGKETRKWYQIMNQKNRPETKKGVNQLGEIELILQWEQPPALHIEELAVVEKMMDDMITSIETWITCLHTMEFMLSEVESDIKGGGEKYSAPSEVKHLSPPREKMPRYIAISGTFFDGAVHGQRVVISYNNGDKYFGPYVDERWLDTNGRTMPEGRVEGHWGKWKCEDGHVFEGPLVDNHWDREYINGEYRVTYPEKRPPKEAYVGEWDVRYESYTGDFVNSYRSGVGEAHYRNGTSYRGEWRDGVRHGDGVYTTSDGASYEGQWNNDHAHGMGKFKWADGASYDGAFYEGKRQGMGRYAMSNGNYYQGEFFANKFHGQGSITYDEGGKYEGPWKYGKRWGKGMWEDEHGVRHTGMFTRGVMNGEMYVERPLLEKDGGGIEYQKGLWEEGSFVDWTSYAVNPHTTDAFVKRFTEDENEYDQQFALLIARRLPILPHGINPSDPRVTPIIARIQRESGQLCGVETERETLAKLALERPLLEAAERDLELAKKILNAKIAECEAQQEKVQARMVIYDRVKQALDKLISELDNHWEADEEKTMDRYEDACEKLRQLTPKEWYQVRKYITPPTAVRRLMECVCYLHLIEPDWKKTCVAMMKNNEQNMLDGDEDAMINTYDVKLLHLLDIYDVYRVSTYEKTIAHIEAICYDPSFMAENIQYVNAGKAAQKLVEYVHATNKIVHRAKAMAKTKQYVDTTQLSLKYNQKLLLDEQSKYVMIHLGQQDLEADVSRCVKARDRIARRVDKLEQIYEEIVEMRVDYVSDDDDRELTYYEQLEADYDQIKLECEFALQRMLDLMEKDPSVRGPKKPKRGTDLYEWIEQEMPAFRTELERQGPFGDAVATKNELVDTIHGHIKAVLHPGDTYEEGAIATIVYRRWELVDHEARVDAAAKAWEEENPDNPGGMTLWAARNPEELSEKQVMEAGCWSVTHPEDIAIAEWMALDVEVTGSEYWEEKFPDIPTDEVVPPERGGKGPDDFGTGFECSDLVMKVRDNEQKKVLTEDLVMAESWAKAHPEEMRAAYKRKADKDAAEWKVFVDSMAEQGFTYDPTTDKFWGIDEESGELYEYKSPEQEAAEAAAWGLFKDKKTGKKYQFNELTGEIVWLD